MRTSQLKSNRMQSIDNKASRQKNETSGGAADVHAASRLAAEQLPGDEITDMKWVFSGTRRKAKIQRKLTKARGPIHANSFNEKSETGSTTN